MSSNVLGLDIGATGVRIVQHGSNGIQQVSIVPLPEDAVVDGEIRRPSIVTDAVRQAWKAGGFKSKSVALPVSNSGVIIRQVDLDWMDPSAFKKALPFLAKEHLPVPVEEVNLDAYPLREEDAISAEGQQVKKVKSVLIAARKDMINEFTDVTMKAGLKPVRFDVTPFSMIRATTQKLDRVSTDLEAIIMIGTDVVNVVVHQGGLPLFIRYIPNNGSNSINKALMTHFRISWEEAEKAKIALGLGSMAVMPGGGGASSSVFGGGDQAAVEQEHPAIPVINAQVSILINEVRTSLDFLLTQRAYQGSTLRQITLMGGGGRLIGLGQRLASELRVGVDLFNPAANFTGKHAGELTATSPDLSAAFGASMGA